MLAAPFWSVILINLGFVLMACEAWRIPDRRWLALFPLLWFGGYLVTTSVSHWQAARYVAEIDAANAGKQVAFDRNRQDVVVEPDRYDETNDSDLRAETLMNSFGLSSAYQRVNYAQDGYRSYLLVGMACPQSEVVKNDDGTTTIYSRPSEMQGYHYSGARDLCIVQSSMAPERPTVFIRPQRQIGRYHDSRVSQDIKIYTPDGKTTILRSGWARPLSWLPQPVMGCALDSGTPAWRCFAAFSRQSVYSPKSDLTPASAAKVVAKALGLTKVTIRQRYPNAGWQ